MAVSVGLSLYGIAIPDPGVFQLYDPDQGCFSRFGSGSGFFLWWLDPDMDPGFFSP